MPQKPIHDQLVAAIAGLLETIEACAPDLDIEGRDAIVNAHHVLNKALEAAKPKM